LRLFSERLQSFPQAVPYMLLALDFNLEEPKRAVVAGGAGSPASKSLLRAIHSVYQPNKVVLGTTGSVEPFARTLPLQNGQPAVYICTGTACQPATREPEKVKQLLK